MQLTRRSFLVTAAAAAAPAFLRATDKSGSKAPILGQGDHQYEAIHDWGQLPRTINYGNTHGVCEDSQGNIYIHHTVNAASDSLDTMVVFDDKGKFTRSWGRQFKGGAHGLGDTLIELVGIGAADVVSLENIGRIHGWSVY